MWVQRIESHSYGTYHLTSNECWPHCACIMPHNVGFVITMPRTRLSYLFRSCFSADRSVAYSSIRLDTVSFLSSVWFGFVDLFSFFFLILFLFKQTCGSACKWTFFVYHPCRAVYIVSWIWDLALLLYAFGLFFAI